MKDKDGPGLIGSLFLVFFFVILLSVLVNIGEAFPTEEKVRDFSKKVEFFSKFFPEWKGIGEYAKTLVESASEKAKGYSSGYEMVFNDPVRALEVLFPVLLAEYLLVFGFILGILSFQAYLVLVVLLLMVGIFLYKHREALEDLVIKWRAKQLSPFKDEKIEYILALLLKNPVPASIFHHNAFEGGLLKHSLNVARLSAKLAKERGLKVKTAFLLGLLHDIGKLKIYRKVPAEESAPAPSPLEGKKKDKKNGKKPKYKWEGLHVNQEVVNKIFIKQLEEKLSLDLPKDPAYWDVVKTADMLQTEKELREGVYEIKDLLIPTIKNLPEGSYWKKGEYFIVLAHAFCRTLTELLLEQDKGLNISTEPDRAGVHVIAYSIPKQLPIIKQIGDVKVDDLGLFDVKVGKTLFKAVYVFPSSLATNVPETEEEISFVQRV
ncbi:MAG: HD domain-containing protein [Thermocrinis sp.]|jgi:putative nucleotidyltransferase with HDIG domain|uniref:HD domain-containing protein n=1 Tax=Thermocrinis sp. TaxID=2024383 RepID=UPI003C0490CE